MKRLKFLPTILLSAGLVGVSCTNLDENLKDTLTPANFPQSNQQIDAALVAPYTNLYNNYSHNGFFTLQEITTDEAMIPQRGGDWYDGGQPQMLHSHFQPPTGAISKPEGFDAFSGTWNNAYSGIAACNRLITTDGISTVPAKVAELKVLRAWYYFYLLDMYGNVPLSTALGTTQGQQTQAAMYAFIDSELTTNVPLLTKSANYGRLTYWAGRAIQGKLYLNAKTYTGTAQYANAITVLDDIINNGGFALESTYADIFSASNAGSKEHIWAIPFDRAYVQGFNLPQMTLHYGSQATYKLQQQPWNGYCSLEEFYNSYSASDNRRKSFITGQQYASDGVTKILDDSYEKTQVAGDPNSTIDPDGAPLNFTPKMNEFLPNALRQAGARLGKFQFVIGATPNLDNDFPVFRLGAVLLDKAECLFRLANDFTNAGGLATMAPLAARTGAGAYNPNSTASVSPITASAPTPEENFLAERGRELFSEAWRRNDLVRFGKYTAVWYGKLAVDPAYINLFPVPLSQITATAGTSAPLKQNPGY